MGLSQLLAVGRSVRTIKDGPARYKMTQQNLLPKFGGEKASEARPAELVSPNAAVASQPAQPQPCASSAVLPGEGRIEHEFALAKAASFVEASRQLRPFSAWSLFRIPLGLWAARKTGTAPLQGELMLDLVRPMRNDLSDSDIDGGCRSLAVPQQDARLEPLAVPTATTAAPGRGLWERMKTVWFRATGPN